MTASPWIDIETFWANYPRALGLTRDVIQTWIAIQISYAPTEKLPLWHDLMTAFKATARKPDTEE